MAKRKPYYIEVDGKKTKVPSVTTICGMLDKPALLSWFGKIVAQLCLDKGDALHHMDVAAILKASYSESSKARDKGTEMHNLIEQVMMGKEVEVDEGELLYLNISDFFADHEVEPMMLGKEPALEVELLSPTYMFGGRCDCIGYIDGVLCLIDWKSGRLANLWPESMMQTAAYRIAAVEQHPAIPTSIRRAVVVFAKEERAYKMRIMDEHDNDFRAFLTLRGLYEWKKRTEKELKK